VVGVYISIDNCMSADHIHYSAWCRLAGCNRVTHLMYWTSLGKWKQPDNEEVSKEESLDMGRVGLV